MFNKVKILTEKIDMKEPVGEHKQRDKNSKKKKTKENDRNKKHYSRNEECL